MGNSGIPDPVLEFLLAVILGSSNTAQNELEVFLIHELYIVTLCCFDLQRPTSGDCLDRCWPIENLVLILIPHLWRPDNETKLWLPILGETCILSNRPRIIERKWFLKPSPFL